MSQLADCQDRAAGARNARRARRGAVAALALGSLVFTTGFAEARPAPDSFADLAAKVTPAVVNISTTQSVERGPGERSRPSPFPPGSPFDEFLKRFFDQENNPFDRQQDRRERSGPRGTALGSGFIIDPAGYVVTNNHVIGKADKIDVKLSDGREFDAKLIGRDEKTDLALLKIAAERPLPFVQFGDSDSARVGDWVLAVGNPFGLGGTVTAGIVSASGRNINSGPYDDFLQTDASINRGNSGGPLFNIGGEVIGVNTAIYSPSGGSVGIGFAIPASIVKPVVAQLRDNGRVERGWLGVQIQEMTPELATSLGLEEAKGALVSAVTPNSPAAKAGLKPGDVILGFDGEAIAQLRDLPRRVAAEKAGEHAKLSLWRDGKSRNVDVVIGAMPSEQVAAADGPASTEPSRTGALGLALAPLTPETRARLGLDKEVEGVAVTSVKPGSPAAEQGLRVGDVVVRVGDQIVTAPRQVAEQIDKARDDGRSSVLLLVARRGGQQFVALPLGKA